MELYLAIVIYLLENGIALKLSFEIFCKALLTIAKNLLKTKK